MSSKGIAAADAPYLLSIIAMVGLPTTLLAGTVLNKLRTHHAGAVFTLILCCSLLILILAQNRGMAIAFAVFQGVAQGIQVVWGSLVWPNYFGTRYLGSIRGFAMTINVIASAIGPIPFGAAFDRFSTYKPVLIVALVLVSISFFIVLVSPKPRGPHPFKNAFSSDLGD